MSALDLTPELDAYVRAAAGGDSEAFGMLVERTKNLVASIAVAILRDVELARDVAQDVFLAAWRDLAKLREPASFLPWLRSLTRNRAHHVLRTQARRRRMISETEADELVAALADARPGAREALIANEEACLLAHALEQLPDEAREIVTLFYREGRSVQQVADLLGVSADAAKQRLSRARARLRRAVLERVGEVLERTAPSAAFTTAVMSALALGGPAVAATAGTGLSLNASAGGLLAKLGALSGPAAPGLVGALGGVFFGFHRLYARAQDERERRDLVRLGTVASVLVVVAALGLSLAYPLTGSRAAVVAIFVAYWLGLLLVLEIGVPRAISRRLAAELASDPQAAARHRRDRQWGYLGWMVGTILGLAGLVLGLILATP